MSRMRPAHEGRGPGLAAGSRHHALTFALGLGTVALLLWLPTPASAQIDLTDGVTGPVPTLEPVSEVTPPVAGIVEEAVEQTGGSLPEAAGSAVDTAVAVVEQGVGAALNEAGQVTDTIEEMVADAAGGLGDTVLPAIATVEGVVASPDAGPVQPPGPESDLSLPSPPASGRRPLAATTQPLDTPRPRPEPDRAAFGPNPTPATSTPSGPGLPQAVISSATTPEADVWRDRAVASRAPFVPEPEATFLIRGPPAALTAAGSVSLVEWPG